MYNEAITNHDDEEKLFILLMKYCEMVQVMNNTFKHDLKYIVPMTETKIKTAISLLVNIKKSLEIR